jgi:hypothetical protein
MSRRKRSKSSRSSNAKRRGGQAYQESNKEQLAGMLDWFLSDGHIFSTIRLHGNTKWLPKCLVCLTLVWAWSGEKHLTDAFIEAFRCCRGLLESAVPSTYQGFMWALTRWTAILMEVLWSRLHQRMEEIGSRFWRIHGWVPIAFDGSRGTAPRTERNEKAFCAPRYGQSNSAKYRRRKIKGMRRRNNDKNKPHPQEPQVWITLLWHMGLRLPWMWQLGPTTSSEREHVTEMVRTRKFAKNTLFCGDAGFVGYPLWSEILQSGGQFLVRVGGNVSLLREGADYAFAQNGLVLCWPQAMQAKQPPLRLRLAKVRLGKTLVYLLTSVLDPKQLTIQQMIVFYKMRWGIEVEFRGLKQTLDRAKLRCRNDQRLLLELNWSILAMAVAELFALKEQLAKNLQPGDASERTATPAWRSLARTMRAIRSCIRTSDAPPGPQGDLRTLLRQAVTDGYRRKKPKRARYRPANPDKKSLGVPKVRKINQQERKRLRQATKEIAA